MRILVTGASGFVGSAVVRELSHLGNDVVRAVGPNRHKGGGVHPIDVSVPGSFPKIEGLDAVINCSGLAHGFARSTRDNLERVNVEGARNVARFSAESGARVLIHLSSVLVYGNCGSKDPIDEQTVPKPQGEYARSKLDGEKAVAEICGLEGLPLVILRPAPIIGEGGKGNVLRLIRAIDRGRFIWIGQGTNRKSLIYVGDVAKAVSQSLKIGKEPGIFNIAGDAVRMKDIVSIISNRLGKRLPKISIPIQVARNGQTIFSRAKVLRKVHRLSNTLETWLSDAVYSGDSFRIATGFVPQTRVEEGLQRQVDHFSQNRW